MTGKEFYKSTFDEVKVSDYMLTRLMVMDGENLVYEKSYGFLYHIAKAIVAFVGVLAASGTLFSVPLL